MKRFLKIAGIVVGLIVVIGALFVFFRYKDAFLVEKQTPEELASVLTPHFVIKHPPGAGPFPAVICFHGSGGLFNSHGNIGGGYNNWADYFVSLGYTSIFVDSYTGRSFNDEDVNKITTARKFSPMERAGDVLVAISEVRKLPFVDSNKLALAGWSAGGSCIMSLFTMDLKDEFPPNLSSVPIGALDGVKGAIVRAPFCMHLKDSIGEKWNKSIKTLVLMGGKDPLTEACLRKVSILEENNCPVKYHVYPNAGHSYDSTQEDLDDYSPDNLKDIDPTTTADSQRRVKEFLEEVFR